jgi:hypothetical protein
MYSENGESARERELSTAYRRFGSGAFLFPALLRLSKTQAALSGTRLRLFQTPDLLPKTRVRFFQARGRPFGNRSRG